MVSRLLSEDPLEYFSNTDERIYSSHVVTINELELTPRRSCHELHRDGGEGMFTLSTRDPSPEVMFVEPR